MPLEAPEGQAALGHANRLGEYRDFQAQKDWQFGQETFGECASVVVTAASVAPQCEVHAL